VPATEVHPSAQVHPRARLADGVRVGPFAVIAADVEIGERSRIEPGTVLYGGTRIGADCRLGPYAILGGEPQDHAFAGEASLLIVEDEVEVREFATVHRATGAGSATTIGRGSLLMCYTHVGHNAVLAERCTLTNGTQLGGHCQVGERAVLGASVEVHQFVRIGALAMVRAKSGVGKDILPFSTAAGSPARHYRLNRLGLERGGFDAERIGAIERALRAVRRRDHDAVASLASESADVGRLVAFLDSSQRGISRFVR
jgi:UDP-N-acetylglucosamine acyltransferase